MSGGIVCSSCFMLFVVLCSGGGSYERFGEHGCNLTRTDLTRVGFDKIAKVRGVRSAGQFCSLGRGFG